MKHKKWVEKKKILVNSSVCVALGLGVFGGVFLKWREKRIEADLQKIGQELLDYHVGELKKKNEDEEFEWQSVLNQIEVIDRNRREMVLKLSYDLVIADELEREYSTQTWMVRIKKMSARQYKILEQGSDMNFVNL